MTEISWCPRRSPVYLLCAFVALGTVACFRPYVMEEQASGRAAPLRAQPRAVDIVRDDVEVLSREEDRKLTALLQKILDRTGVKVLVVLVPTTKPDPSERYGGRLVEYWAKRGALDPAQTVVAVLAVDDRHLSVLAGSRLPALQRELAGGGALSFLVPYLKEERYFDAMMALGHWLSERIRNRTDGPGRSVVTPLHDVHLPRDSTAVQFARVSLVRPHAGELPL